MVNNTKEFGGKIVGGSAADGERAYFGLGEGAIGAIEIRNGSESGSCCWLRLKGAPSTRAAKAARSDPGHRISGGFDGVMRALSASDGKVVWQFDTLREFQTVNGVAAKGGSIGAAGPVVAGGILFVPSGYVGVKNSMPGTLLLAFSSPQE